MKAAVEAKKPVAAVCHGPWALRFCNVKTEKEDGVSMLKGSKFTCFSRSEEAVVGLTNVVPYEMEKAATVVEATYSSVADWAPYVVESVTAVGGPLVTGQNPASSGLVAEAFLKVL